MWKWIYPGKESYLYICERMENKDWWRKWDVFIDRWFFLSLWSEMTFLTEKQRSEITAICSKMTCSEMNGNPNLYTHQPHEVLHSYAVISTLGAHSPCQRLFMCCFRFRSSLKKCLCLRPKAEDKSACGRQSSSSHVRKNLWYPV